MAQSLPEHDGTIRESLLDPAERVVGFRCQCRGLCGKIIFCIGTYVLVRTISIIYIVVCSYSRSIVVILILTNNCIIGVFFISSRSDRGVGDTFAYLGWNPCSEDTTYCRARGHSRLGAERPTPPLCGCQGVYLLAWTRCRPVPLKVPETTPYLCSVQCLFFWLSGRRLSLMCSINTIAIGITVFHSNVSSCISGACCMCNRTEVRELPLLLCVSNVHGARIGKHLDTILSSLLLSRQVRHTRSLTHSPAHFPALNHRQRHFSTVN